MSDPRASMLHRLLLRCFAALVLCLVSFGDARPAPAADASGSDPFETPESFGTPGDEADFFKVESDVVTSVSRHPESSWGAAAAITVVTGEEIEASGAQSLTDALRIVPGLDVASVDRNTNAVSARGLNNTFADKMLVLLDGRPIYNPIFGGTIWHEWNQFVPDIDRIEVIRGPGGTLWGANAMNGVINIITKSAEDTHGGIARALGGSNYQGQGEMRYGNQIGTFDWRLWGRYSTDNGFGGDGGDKIDDERRAARAGYRFDYDLGRGLVLRSTGDFYRSRLGSVITELSFPGGVPTTARVDANPMWNTTLYTSMWRAEKDFTGGSSGHIQIAGDYEKSSVPYLAFTSPLGNDDWVLIRRSFEAEAQHSFRWLRRNRLTWGVNFRATNIDVNDSVTVGLDPQDDTLEVAGAFVQNEVALWNGAELTLGTKLENNSFTDLNVQPSARLTQRFGESTTLWGSISRAVNTPSYGDRAVRIEIPATPPLRTLFAANTSTDDTEMIAYELGFRTRPLDRLSFDLAAFYNDYDGVVTFSGQTFGNPADFGFDDGDPGTFDTVILLDNERNAHAY
ncbi:MAG TPA: TonB-dependent receptor plug domain-containing protein, partial [Candidatus Binatia bacterium]|nr:TonB-dependent receptor plug domain-containing protein [Candidatus Binatia bacterium]